MPYLDFVHIIYYASISVSSKVFAIANEARSLFNFLSRVDFELTSFLRFLIVDTFFPSLETVFGESIVKLEENRELIRTNWSKVLFYQINYKIKNIPLDKMSNFSDVERNGVVFNGTYALAFIECKPNGTTDMQSKCRKFEI